MSVFGVKFRPADIIVVVSYIRTMDISIYDGFV
jgi:hypothetical protein